MDRESERIGLQEIIDKALEEMPREAGESFELDPFRSFPPPAMPSPIIASVPSRC